MSKKKVNWITAAALELSHGLGAALFSEAVACPEQAEIHSLTAPRSGEGLHLRVSAEGRITLAVGRILAKRNGLMVKGRQELVLQELPVVKRQELDACLLSNTLINFWGRLEGTGMRRLPVSKPPARDGRWLLSGWSLAKGCLQALRAEGALDVLVADGTVLINGFRHATTLGWRRLTK